MQNQHMPIIVAPRGPLYDLTLAINLYVSTGDYVGSAAWCSSGRPDRFFVVIPYKPASPLDAEQFAKFRSRIEEIAKEGRSVRFWEAARQGCFVHWFLEVDLDEARWLAPTLILDGGAAGFRDHAKLIRKGLGHELDRITRSFRSKRDG